MQLYGKYIAKIAETFAWCFMPNHFHFLVRIKDEEDIGFIPRNNNLPDIENFKYLHSVYKRNDEIDRFSLD